MMPAWLANLHESHPVAHAIAVLSLVALTVLAGNACVPAASWFWMGRSGSVACAANFRTSQVPSAFTAVKCAPGLQGLSTTEISAGLAV